MNSTIIPHGLEPLDHLPRIGEHIFTVFEGAPPLRCVVISMQECRDLNPELFGGRGKETESYAEDETIRAYKPVDGQDSGRGGEADFCIMRFTEHATYVFNSNLYQTI